jgi:alkylresorcinol/alkylpyrone synthase
MSPDLASPLLRHESHQVGLVTGLLSVGHAVPPHRMLQSDAAAAARRIFAHRYAAFERMAPVFETAGIRTRHTVKPIDWYLTDLGWPERNAAYLEGAQELFIDAASRALANAGCEAREVDTIVTIPRPASPRPASRPGSPAAWAFAPMSSACRCSAWAAPAACPASPSPAAGARPAGSTVLMVAIEICTAALHGPALARQHGGDALFGDGAAACVVRTGESGLARIEGAGEHLWPDSLDIMGWKVDPSGLGVIFDRAIPPFAEEHVGSAVDGILARIGVARGSVDRFACHPGGAKVITALETTLRLDQGTLDHERAVLEAYGNMSAPTVLFVLERLVRQGLPRRTVLTALGPGFTCSCLSLAEAA